VDEQRTSDVPIVATVKVGDADKSIAALTTAFVGDPLMRWLYPSAQDYLRGYPRLLQVYCAAALAAGTVFSDLAFAGVAVWLSPGTVTDEAATAEVAKATIAAERLETYARVTRQAEQYHPVDEPLWYLPFVGVDATAQGKGVGSALMEHALRLCDEQGARAYLESSNPANLSLYERLGFQVMGRIEVGSVPPITPMIRERRQVATPDVPRYGTEVPALR